MLAKIMTLNDNCHIRSHVWSNDTIFKGRMSNMADMTAFEEMCQNMRAQWPGMPEKDVKNIVS